MDGPAPERSVVVLGDSTAVGIGVERIRDGLAARLAAEIAENTSAVSVCLARQMMWRMLGADHPMEAHKVDSRAIYAMGRSPDSYEGVQSFLEKRPPRFPMRVSSDLPDFFPWWEERRFK